MKIGRGLENPFLNISDDEDDIISHLNDNLAPTDREIRCKSKVLKNVDQFDPHDIHTSKMIHMWITF